MKSDYYAVKKVVLSLLIISFFVFNGYGQDGEWQELKNELTQIGLEFILPLEKDIRINRSENSFAKEDFKVSINGQDVLIYLYRENDTRITFPHLEFARLITHLSANEEESNVYVYDVPLEDNINWMGEARFTPKNQVSNRSYATAKAFYKEGYGMYLLVYLDKKITAFFEPVIAFVDTLDNK